MPTEHNYKNHVSKQVMELKDLISGPLVATIDADTMSARRYLRYLCDLAFESYDQTTGKAGQLRMLEFSYQTKNGNGHNEQTISIPLLTLVPLPLLQVQEANFDFDIQIIDAVQADRNSTISFSNPKGEDCSSKDEEERMKTEGLKLRVAIAPQGSEKTHNSSKNSLTANMKVNVKMKQADMPGGLMKLLQLTTNNAMMEESRQIKDKPNK